jgi:hypothetical protein
MSAPFGAGARRYAAATEGNSPQVALVPDRRPIIGKPTTSL